MGQYFKLINVDKQEFVSLPGMMKAIERVTNPVAMGMVGYLLFEGPLDGTGRLLGLACERKPDLVEEAIDAKIERETEIEEKRFQEYIEEQPNHIVDSFERETDLSLETLKDEFDNGEEFEAFCKQESYSIYRKDNLNWDREMLATSAMAVYEISEALDFAGRWAGDDIRFVGDYAENGLYDETTESWRYEYKGEEFVTYATASCPIVPNSIERDDIVHSIRDREPEPGDMAQVKHPDTGERVYCHYLGVEPGVWDNITDGLTEEFVQFVGEDWIEGHDNSGIMAPDMVLTAD